MTPLLKVVEDTGAKTLTYLYDFGDGWEHTVKIERIEPPQPAVTYPVLIEALGRCPPEHVGGPPGYEEFLAALADLGHERHSEMVERHGETFDPAAVDLVELDRALQDTAPSWNRTRKAKPT